MGFCVPNCVEWTIYDSSIHKLEDTLLGVGFTVGIISGLIVLVTWIFVRQMLLYSSDELEWLVIFGLFVFKRAGGNSLTSYRST